MTLSTRDAYRLDFLLTALHGDRWDILQSLAAKAKEIEQRTDLEDELVRGVLEDEASFQRLVQIGALPMENAERALELAQRVVREARKDESFRELGHVVSVQAGHGSFDCLCGVTGPVREAGVHLFQVNASAIDLELSKAKNAGLLQLRQG